MTCPACDRARKKPLGYSGLYHGDCAGCRGRAIAILPQAKEAQQRGFQTAAYRALLDQAKVTHEDVVPWLQMKETAE